jgi:hypothetical protein
MKGEGREKEGRRKGEESDECSCNIWIKNNQQYMDKEKSAIQIKSNQQYRSISKIGLSAYMSMGGGGREARGGREEEERRKRGGREKEEKRRGVGGGHTQGECNGMHLRVCHRCIPRPYHRRLHHRRLIQVRCERAQSGVIGSS